MEKVDTEGTYGDLHLTNFTKRSMETYFQNYVHVFINTSMKHYETILEDEKEKTFYRNKGCCEEI